MSQKLTQKQLYAITMLAEGNPIGFVASSLKLRRETISRWQMIPEFKEEYKKLTNELQGDLKTQLSDLLMTTVQTIKSTITSYDFDPKRVQSMLDIIKILGIDNIKEEKTDKPENNNCL